MTQFVLRCWRTAAALPRAVPVVGRVVRRAIRRHLAVGHVASRVIWRGSILVCVLVPVAIGATLLPDLPPLGGQGGPGAGPGGTFRDLAPPGGGGSLFFPPSPGAALEPLLRELGGPPLVLPPPPAADVPVIPAGGVVGAPRAIPEPATWLLFGLAALTAAGLRGVRRPAHAPYRRRDGRNPD